MHRTALIIYNPVAGSGVGEAVARRAGAELETKGWTVRMRATRDRSGAKELVREHAHEADLVVLAGGDGTLREAVEGLEDRAVDIGLLPIGNANVAARELGIPLDADRAMRWLSEGEPTPVDLGHFRSEAGTGLFVAMVGVGWDAITVGLLDRLRHTRLGRLWYRLWADSAYLVCGLLAMLRPGQPRFRLRVDGETLPTQFRAAYLCNFRNYAKGMAMTPEAHHQSGRLHYHGRLRAAPPAAIWHVISAWRGRRAPSFVSSYGDGMRIQVESAKPLAVQIDGDFRGQLSAFEVEIRPAAIRILAPPRTGA